MNVFFNNVFSFSAEGKESHCVAKAVHGLTLLSAGMQALVTTAPNPSHPY